MNALNRKLFRDVWRLRGQGLAIALVVASGVAVLVLSLSTMEALRETMDAYYDRYRFAHVFAGVKRAPERLADRIAAIPGVQSVETRVVEFSVLDVPGFDEPVTGSLVSIPEDDGPHLNRLVLRSGRLVRQGKSDEVVLNEPFAEAHGLQLGDTLDAIINGTKRSLRVVGTALSPEHIYVLGPGALMPDKKRYGILWMGQDALAGAYDLEGAFNDVVLTLMRGAEPQDVIDRLDTLLDRYGGVGAIARKNQISNWFLTNEMQQMRTMATVLPSIFLTIAAFLTNMVLSRLIATERSEIGLMKAFGYGTFAIGWHYLKMVMIIAGLGILIGWLFGAWLGRFNTQTYAEIYRFPFLLYRPSPMAFMISGLVSLSSAMLGALIAVRAAINLPPAEAMRPPAPPLYRNRGLLATGFGGWFDQSTRMILRQMVRWPGRSLVTIIGIATTVSVMIMTLQWLDSIDALEVTQFQDAQRQTLMVSLTDAKSEDARFAFKHMPGVLAVEPARGVTVRFTSGLRTHRGSIEGVLPTARLQVVFDTSGRVIAVPDDGLVLSSVLAAKLEVGRGDSVTVKVLEGRRPELTLPVVDIFDTYIGTPAYMHLDALNRHLREPPSLQTVSLFADENDLPSLFAELKENPSVAGVVLRQAAIDMFNETLGQTVLIFVWIFIGFACTLAIGIVYNGARIALSERGRELATLRVLGFGTTDITYILLGEVAILTLIGLPLGCLLGTGLCWVMNTAFATELFRVPLVIEASTYGFSVVFSVVATVISAALVQRRLSRLDLIAVLKTRE
ncbi:MAG: FtsX-like permease family protein [Pseudomonadota bacterium]